MKTLSQFIRFSIVGAIVTGVHVFFLYFYTEFIGFYYILSSLFAFMIAVTVSFVLNKLWSFKDRSSEGVNRKYLKFLLVSLSAMIVNLDLLFFFTEVFKIYYLFSQLLATFFSLWVNFFGSKFWTFRIK